MEEGQKKGEDPIERDSRIDYARRPSNRPTNKLRLGFKVELNPKIKEHIVIEDENEKEPDRYKEGILAESVPQAPTAEKTPWKKIKRATR